MTGFVLHSSWVLASPADPVWEALHDVKRWPQWWPYVRQVTEIDAGDDEGIGAVHRYTWSSRLPYTLSFDMRVTELRRPHRLSGAASGELDGTGTWTLAQEGDVTRVGYEWRVRVTKLWMKLSAPLARPVFAWNHDQVMQAGGDGLARWLGVRRIA